MDLTISHEVRDFFRNTEYRDETTSSPDILDIFRCFRALASDRMLSTGVKLGKYVVTFDSLADYEEGTVTVLEYAAVNDCQRTKMPLVEARKLLVNTLKEEWKKAKGE